MGVLGSVYVRGVPSINLFGALVLAILGGGGGGRINQVGKVQSVTDGTYTYCSNTVLEHI
jgi:hypothetical protein